MWCLGPIVEVSNDRQTQSEDRVILDRRLFFDVRNCQFGGSTSAYSIPYVLDGLTPSAVVAIGQKADVPPVQTGCSVP
jgi:hypothetical protein